MANTAAVLHHIAELYAKPKKDQKPEDAVREYEEKLNIRFEKYDEAFKDFYTADLIRSVSHYWRWSTDKTRPKLAEITAFLLADEKTQKVEEINNNIPKFKYSSVENEYFEVNKSSSLYQHCLLPDYSRAVKFIIEELLPEKIGFDKYRKIKNDYSAKVSLSKRNGLFNNFNTVLLNVYNKFHGIMIEQQANNGNFEF